MTVMAVGVASGALAASDDVSPTPFGIPTKKITNPSVGITAVRGDRMWFWTQQTRSEEREINMSAEPQLSAQDLEQGTAARYDQELSRSIHALRNVLITLSGITPTAPLFIIAPVALAVAGSGSVANALAATRRWSGGTVTASQRCVVIG